jgi:hypothetical protein
MPLSSILCGNPGGMRIMDVRAKGICFFEHSNGRFGKDFLGEKAFAEWNGTFPEYLRRNLGQTTTENFT